MSYVHPLLPVRHSHVLPSIYGNKRLNESASTYAIPSSTSNNFRMFTPHQGGEGTIHDRPTASGHLSGPQLPPWQHRLGQLPDAVSRSATPGFLRLGQTPPISTPAHAAELRPLARRRVPPSPVAPHHAAGLAPLCNKANHGRVIYYTVMSYRRWLTYHGSWRWWCPFNSNRTWRKHDKQ